MIDMYPKCKEAGESDEFNSSEVGKQFVVISFNRHYSHTTVFM
jgi:hypothetical protein